MEDIVKTFTLTFITILLGFSFNANASVAALDKEIYRCSDGKNYGVLRHYWGGWDSGRWNLVGFCNESLLTEDHYNGRYTPVREAHADIAACQDEDTPAVRACYYEFEEKNGTKGGELTPLVHGRQDDAQLKDYSTPTVVPATYEQNAIVESDVAI